MSFKKVKININNILISFILTLFHFYYKVFLYRISGGKNEINQQTFYSDDKLSFVYYGFGKRSSSYQFRVSNRGGSGIMCIATSDRNGNVLASFPVNNDDDIMLITKTGQLIRCPVKDVRVAGRNTQGVSIFKTTKEEKVVSASRVELDS